MLHHLIDGKKSGSRARRSRRARPALRPRCEVMEDRTLLATMLWANVSGGDWDVAGNWFNSANSSDHHVPTSADDAEIIFTGITITHASSVSDTAHSLTSKSNVKISGGSLTLGANSTITDLSVSSGATLTLNSLTLSGT